MVKSTTDAERFNADFAKLKSLTGKEVRYNGRIFTLQMINTVGDIIIIRTHWLFQNYEIHKSRLSEELYHFTNPRTNEPFFKADGSDKDYDEAFIMKLILRHESGKNQENNPVNQVNPENHGS